MNATLDALLERAYARTRNGAPRDPRRARALLDALAIPDPPHAVVVVGTNGKGGVATRIAAGLQAAGRRPLRFLSPHVERFHERIAVDGVPIPDDAVAAFLRAILDAPAATDAAFFDLTLAMALAHGATHRAPWAVLEAGVGGARDATRAVRRVRAVVVTNVGADHLATLGPTLADVARAKAGAIRPGVPVVSAAQGDAADVVADVARARGAPLSRVAAEDVRGGIDAVGAALARATLRRLALDRAARDAALQAAEVRPRLPARRERFRLPEGRTVLLDGAHNPPAARALADEAPEGAHLLLGVSARKDAAAIRAAFADAARVVLTGLPGDAVAWPDDPAYVPDPDAALARALADLPPGATLIATGSLHLAGRWRPPLRARASGA
ncbi:MAG: hypothetical protein RI554_02220 [Trueperaceae bacterium]|nr:hypothetical protein [Trueperaceae bacterium]